MLSTYLGGLAVKLVYRLLRVLLDVGADSCSLALSLVGVCAGLVAQFADTPVELVALLARRSLGLLAVLAGLGCNVGAGDFGLLLGLLGAAGNVLLDLMRGRARVSCEI
jgi:hypothetical protein